MKQLTSAHTQATPDRGNIKFHKLAKITRTQSQDAVRKPIFRG